MHPGSLARQLWAAPGLARRPALVSEFEPGLQNPMDFYPDFDGRLSTGDLLLALSFVENS